MRPRFRRSSPGPRLLGGILALLVGVLGVGASPDGRAGWVEPRFPLAVAPARLVTEAAQFAPFAQAVAAEVERQLATLTAVDDPATLSLLLSTRVHLAHHFREDERALVTAAWIRSRQTDPAARAFAGLTTAAAVAARRAHPGARPGDPDFLRVFRTEFDRQLAGLPRTPEMAAFLRGQQDKMAGITEAALLAEVRDVIAPAIARRGYCGLAEADQLVRVRHRLQDILPVRGEMLAALAAALADRTER